MNSNTLIVCDSKQLGSSARQRAKTAAQRVLEHDRFVLREQTRLSLRVVYEIRRARMVGVVLDEIEVRNHLAKQHLADEYGYTRVEGRGW